MNPYRWAMRYGSQILFCLSILIVLAAFMQVFDGYQQARADGIPFEGIQTFSRFRILISAVGRSLLLGAVPFAAALVIDRADRFLSVREEAAE